MIRWLTALVAAVVWQAAPLQAAPLPPPPPVPAAIPVALLVDLGSGQTLYARDPARRFMPASVTKVMTAYTAFRLVEQGRLRLDAQFLYTPELEAAWYGEGSNMFLRAGERPTIDQLLLGVTTVSGNDASVALAEAATGSLDAWLALMNAEAARLGMRDTHFASASGFPDGGRTYTTAHDLALLGEALTQEFPGLYRRFFGHRSLTWRGLTQVNHDPITGRVLGADGMKTGFTNEAGYTFLGSAERNGRRLVMVLAGSPRGSMRDEAARGLIEWGFAQFRLAPLFAPGAIVGQARVQEGSRRHVALVAPDGVAVSLPLGAQPAPGGAWRLAIAYDGPLRAPLDAGEEVATLRLLDGETVVMETPLVAGEAVARAGLWRRIVNGLAGLVA